MRKRHLASLIVAFGLLLPTSAGATWGNKCSLGNGHHCYAVAQWEMTGSGNGGGEEVKGLSSEFYTTAMLVPQWENGDFVTNEQWMSGYYGRWVEDGQVAGYNSPSEEGREVNYDSLHCSTLTKTAATDPRTYLRSAMDVQRLRMALIHPVGPWQQRNLMRADRRSAGRVSRRLPKIRHPSRSRNGGS
jgi:hypothetical protein